MEVRAIERGFFGKLREPGDVFDVPDGATASWWEEAEGGEESPPEPKHPEPMALSELDKQPTVKIQDVEMKKRGRPRKTK